jgi:F0F1-type ATP synthase membrane subunit a
MFSSGEELFSFISFEFLDHVLSHIFYHKSVSHCKNPPFFLTRIPSLGVRLEFGNILARG